MRARLVTIAALVRLGQSYFWMLTKCQVDITVKFSKYLVDQLSSWPIAKLNKCEVDQMSSRPIVKLAKYQVAKYKVGKMSS